MRATRRARPVEIMLVEDNPGDVRLAREALRNVITPHRLSTVSDGMQATAFLHREEPFAEAPRPDLILLDLNLPKKDGRQVLAEIKADPDLKRIPVVVLSSSGTEQDIVAAYDLFANCYVVKPADLDQYMSVVSSIAAFWLTTAELPPSGSSR